MQSLYILEPLSPGACEIQVPADGRAKVGREVTNEFSLPRDLQMSSVHFEIGAESGGCRIRDLDSSNGLFLNTRRVSTAIVVEGDEIQAGESRWRLVVRGGVPNSGISESPSELSPYASLSAPAMAWPANDPPQSDALTSELQLTAGVGLSRKLTAAQSLTIGRTASAQWVFDGDGQMSSCHMKVSNQAGVWTVKDLKSSNGTFVNGSRVSETQLFSGDKILGGQTQFVVTIIEATPDRGRTLPEVRPIEVAPAESYQAPVSPRSATALAGDYAARVAGQSAADLKSNASLRRLSDGQEFELALNQQVTLGRSPELPISLPNDFEVSTRHASLLFDGRGIQLRDVGSSNGTFVGGKRVTVAELLHGDRLRVGQTEFVVCLQQTPQAEANTSAHPLESPPAAVQGADLPFYNMTDTSERPLQSEPSDRFEPSKLVSETPTGQEPSADVSHSTAEGDTVESESTESGSTETGTAESGGDGENADDASSAIESTAAIHLPENSQQSRELDPIATGELAETPDDTAQRPSEITPEGAEPQQANDEPVAYGEREEPAPHEYCEHEHELEHQASPQVESSDSTSISESGLESKSHEGQPASAQEMSRVGAPSSPLDLDDKTAYAVEAVGLRAVCCPSGLFVYRGEASALEPVDICLRLLQATSGWVLNGSEIESWIEAASQGLSGLPREWLNPSRADDASWMLPFLGSWGSGSSWLVLARGELEDGLQSLRNLRQPAAGEQPLISALTPADLAAFLASQDSQVVQQFFAPFDAILLEVGAGERWALFGGSQLEAILQASGQ